MSPAAAASTAVAARARGPSRATRSVRVSGPRLLLSTTSYPASTASRATVLPMLPLPMSPIVVMLRQRGASGSAFRGAGNASRRTPGRSVRSRRERPGGARGADGGDDDERHGEPLLPGEELAQHDHAGQ